MRDRSGSRRVILVVDDEPDMRAALRMMFEDAYVVIEAADGWAALEMARRRRIDLVILDVLLPGPSGLEVLGQLRRTDASVQVILVTAVRDVQTAVAAMKLGAVEYVVKPFDTDALVDVVRQTLGAPSSAPDGPVLILSSDLGLRASVVVALRYHWVVYAAATVAEARWQVLTDSPGVVVLDQGMARPEDWPAAPAVFFTRPLRLASVLHEVFDRLVPSDAGRRRPQFSRLTAGVIDYVAAHYADASVGDIARAADVSSRRLTERFGADTTMTVKEYLMRVRIDAARSLLAATDEKLDAVAERVGLYDASHLSRVFRQYGEPTPGSCRRRVSLV